MDWMQNKARGVFSPQWDRPGIAHMSLGRIRKAGLSDDVLSEIETKINSVIQQHVSSDGIYSPKGELIG